MNWNFWASIIERPEENKDKQGTWQRKKAVIHHGDWYLASFDTVRQYKRFCRKLGINPVFSHSERGFGNDGGRMDFYDINLNIVDHSWIYSKRQAPRRAKKFKALSNGRIVDCFFVNDGQTLKIFRMSPYSKRYNPLPNDRHIAYQKKHGTY